MARVVFTPGWEQRIELAAQPIVEHIVEEVADDARRLAPVRTGALKASIEADGNRVNAGGGHVDYAVYQELGTRNMAAHPYLRPALYKKRSE